MTDQPPGPVRQLVLSLDRDRGYRRQTGCNRAKTRVVVRVTWVPWYAERIVYKRTSTLRTFLFCALLGLHFAGVAAQNTPDKPSQPAPSQARRTGRTIRNQDLPSLTRARVSQSIATASSQPAGSAVTTAEKSNAETAPPAGKDEPKKDGSADSETKASADEAEWRGRFREARLRLRLAQEKDLVLQLRINEVRNRFFIESDGSTRTLFQQQLSAGAAEVEANMAEISAAEQALEKLVQSARNEGVSEDWMREGVPPTAP